ncbi:YslB family protein [Virgibacillus doumboii]|uniref:YslB family protein n=1 Tax=Virgibacillus doumboii TaxID=2697503 RepID=UPI0013E04003|nr:YslB family protein [Virgibacillus doumboii]
MAKDQESMSVALLDDLHTSGAGYDILRYISLPELLGTESNTLLYFMGKNLARKLEIQTISDIIYSFDKLGWGRLELVKEKKKVLTFHLMADAVVYRLSAPFDTEFRLEAGFLAEALQSIKSRPCECTEEINKKIHQVEFSVVYTD